MADLTAAGTGAGGLGTAAARWSFVFVWACGVLQVLVDGSLAAEPLAWAIALPAGLVGALLLTTPGARPLVLARLLWLHPLALLVVWAALASAESVGELAALNFATYLMAFQIPRGNVVAGSVGSGLLIGAAVAWALPQSPDGPALAMLIGVPLGCVAAGVMWRLVLKWIVRSERAHRGSAERSAERAVASAEAIAFSRAELAAIGDLVVPVLDRLANGEVIDAELRTELARAEAAVRDRIRAPHLQHPELMAEVDRLRRDGVAVVLLGEPAAPDQLVDARLAEACRTAIAPVTSGRVTIRTFPANRPASLSVVVQTEDEAVQVQWSAAGELVASG